MPRIDHKLLLAQLQCGVEVRLIAQFRGIGGDVHMVRGEIVRACLQDAFIDLVMSDVPEQLTPVISPLWESWRKTAGIDVRQDVKQLRRLARGTAQMTKAFGNCVQMLDA